jgi:phosphonate transport system substrate-binding protein
MTRHNKLIVFNILCIVLVISCGVAHSIAAEQYDDPQQPDKLIFVFQKQKDPVKVEAEANRMAVVLGRKIGIPVEILVPRRYSLTVQALISNRAHVAYVSALPYLLAKARAPVRVLLAEERASRTDYDSIFVVRKDSPWQHLGQLKSRNMAFTSSTSTSGYVMAYSRLVSDGFLKKGQSPDSFFSHVMYAGGYDRALLAVLNGHVDVCAVSYYTMEGPTADLYLKKEQRDQLRVLTRTPGVPTHLVCVRTDLAESLRDKIKNALLDISRDQPDLLADVYGAAKLVEVVEENHLRGAVRALENTGLDLDPLVHH